MMYLVGFGKKALDIAFSNITMQAYGMHFQKTQGVHDELMARTMCFAHSDQLFFYTNLEMGFVSDDLCEKIFQQLLVLKIVKDRSQLMISAQHTHSSPGGIDSYPLYNIPNNGHVDEIIENIVVDTVDSIIMAYQDLQQAKLYFKTGEFSVDTPVAFNRSLNAYLKNPEAKNHQGMSKREAVNNKMRVLHVVRDHDEGFISWFGVHGTSLSNLNKLISGDNKGDASIICEKKLSLAIFAQECAGDITPNYIWDKKRNRMGGPFRDEFKNSFENGQYQAQLALDILKTNGEKISGDIVSNFRYHDFSKIKVNPKFNPKGFENKELRTHSSALGVSFIEGTLEGKGIPKFLGFFLKWIIRFNKFLLMSTLFIFNRKKYIKTKSYYDAQYPKDIVVDAGFKKVIGQSDPKFLKLLAYFDETINNFVQHLEQQKIEENTWLQEVLPLQVTKIGQIALMAVPSEPTTIAGQRIRNLALSKFIDFGVNIKDVIISTYSNGYSGYITTPEEYQVQNYEGGHTLFGRWTLPGYMTYFELMINSLIRDKREVEIKYKRVRPFNFSSEELDKRKKNIEQSQYFS